MSQLALHGAKNGSARTARAIHDAQLVVAYAETAGLVDPSSEAGISVEQFNDALRSLASAGVARSVQPLKIPASPEELGKAARTALDSIEISPLPRSEWPALYGLLESLLPSVVGVSPSSIFRYRSGERETPDQVAARLHTIALIVRDLAGSYNEFGIRRWFQRPRAALDGKSPADILSGDWDPDSCEVRRVRDLAAGLIGPGIG